MLEITTGTTIIKFQFDFMFIDIINLKWISITLKISFIRIFFQRKNLIFSSDRQKVINLTSFWLDLDLKE